MAKAPLYSGGKKMRGEKREPLAHQVKGLVQKLPKEEDRQLLMEFIEWHNELLPPWHTVQAKLRFWMHTYPGRAATHDVIAEEIGTSRETVSREILAAFISYRANPERIW